MKIKTKKQLNLPQLIEWAWDNDVKGKTFYARETGMENVHFNTSGRAEFSSVHQFSSDDYFTVEVEEEITEDTVIDELLMIYDGGGSELTYNKSLNNLGLSQLKSAYIMNDDLRLILIWRDGKLVE
ncbi:hypothetical protein [Staphylococcus gallinarum]|uniref:hypothetical protein n=1 Tax=Staphylococcus gallinarum TaxID=1293 RepID=UPI001C1F9E7C|nr:hypothetical protein [Staphylococcus gallinarum]MBU7218807.1 hypothetical protein [Staphylococcus gallinarum]